MKKFMIIAAGLATLSFSADAQKMTTKNKKANKVADENILSKKNEGQYFSFGPIAGFGHSWISGMSDLQFKPSGYLGASLVFSKYEHWGWGVDLIASHEGYRMDYVRAGNEYTTTIDPTYLRLTPKAYYYFGKYGDNIRPKIFLGPSLGVKLVEDQHTNDNNMYYEGVTPITANNSSVFNTLDFGVEGGLGVNFKVAKHIWLNVDASYYHGLTYATEMDDMNRNIKLNAGLMFGL